MGDIRSMTGKEIFLAAIGREAAMIAEYPEERLAKLTEELRHRDPTGEEIRMFRELKEVDNFEIAIVANAKMREFEYLGVEVADALIAYGVEHWNVFRPEITNFLANQLWRLDAATMTEAEGVAYIAAKLMELAPDEGYEVSICNCENCLRTGQPTLVIENQASRDSTRQREAGGLSILDIIMSR